VAKTKVKISASDISDKWSRRLKGAIPDITAGVDRVAEAPGALAAEKADKMRQRLIEALDAGIWQARVSAVPLATWKEVTKKKVTQRLAGGVDEAKGKRQQFDRWLVDRLNAVLPEIAAMPDLTLEDSINRVRALIEHMAAERYKKSA
jgi:hypothetical protein